MPEIDPVTISVVVVTARCRADEEQCANQAHCAQDTDVSTYKIVFQRVPPRLPPLSRGLVERQTRKQCFERAC